MTVYRGASAVRVVRKLLTTSKVEVSRIATEGEPIMDGPAIVKVRVHSETVKSVENLVGSTSLEEKSAFALMGLGLAEYGIAAIRFTRSCLSQGFLPTLQTLMRKDETTSSRACKFTEEYRVMVTQIHEAVMKRKDNTSSSTSTSTSDSE